MKAHFYSFLKNAALTTYFLGVICLIVGVLLTIFHYPVRAAEPLHAENSQGSLQQQAACSVPPDWNQTVRLFYQRQITQEWTFDVEEAEMDVDLEFFYYQDRERDGCPFDCSAGDCQLDEIGEGTSPFGEFTVEDGIEGANSGSIRQSGRLPQGSYTASFSVTGKGSINIGLRIKMESVPLPPADTATPTPTQETATPTQVVLPPVPTATNTLPPVEATPTENVTSPAPTQTPTSTPETPTGITPTATPTNSVLPPVDSGPTPTATPIDEVRPPRPKKTATPPATLPPPSAPTQSGQPPILVPVTGGDLAAGDLQSGLVQSVFMKLGAALLGLALVLHRIRIYGKSIPKTGERRNRSR
jgi:hypothetical protein